jgi:hypothetical protein
MIAVDSTQGQEWVNAKFLAAAAPLARRISVKWGEKLSVDLPITAVVIK